MVTIGIRKMNVFRLIRHYNCKDELVVINLMHIVSMKQKDEIIRFYSVSDKELMVDFPDKETAKHEIVDIIRTLNRHVSPPGSP
jgi:hypothetical protein